MANVIIADDLTNEIYATGRNFEPRVGDCIRLADRAFFRVEDVVWDLRGHEINLEVFVTLEHGGR